VSVVSRDIPQRNDAGSKAPLASAADRLGLVKPLA